MEYGHEQAVADGVNVDFTVYRIRTRISEHGSTIEAGLFVDRRNRETRKVWSEQNPQGRWRAYECGDILGRDKFRAIAEDLAKPLA